MSKLYYENQYKINFETEIKEIIEKSNEYHIVLQDTYFFPGGGGQFCDLGSIDNTVVINVYEENSTIYHVTKSKPANTIVKCSINWNRREDGMHQHLGQHILSGCFYERYNANTFGFHLGNEYSTVDIIGNIDNEKLDIIESMANNIINQNISIETLTPNSNEIKDIWVRREIPDTNEQIRIVNIGDLDSNACCGIHPKSTLELRMIKLVKTEKINKGTRVTFLAGQRAINYIMQRDKNMAKICTHLKSSDNELINYIQNIQAKLEVSTKKINDTEDRLIEYYIKDLQDDALYINNYEIISSIFKNEDKNFILKLASSINNSSNKIGLFAIENDDDVVLIYCCSKNIKYINMNNVIKDSLEALNGRGGGNYFLAQGGGVNNNIDLILKNAINKTIGLVQ